MKVLKKLSSLALACCMACTMLFTAAGATEENAAPHANGTALCQIVIATEERQSIKEIAVEIPAGATAEQEAWLVRTAVYQEIGIQVNTRAAKLNTIFTTGSLTIHDTALQLGTGTVPDAYKTIVVDFSNLYNGNGATTLYVNARNVSKGISRTQSITLGNVIDYTYFVESRNSLSLSSGNEIAVYAYTDAGYARAGSCEVSGCTDDYGAI